MNLADEPILPLHTWASVRSELFWIYENPLPINVQVLNADYRHGNRAWLLSKGSVRVITESGKVWQARAGEWLFLPTEKGRHVFSSDAVLLSVQFVCQWPDGANLFAGSDGLVLKAKDYPDLELTARKLLELVQRTIGKTWVDYPRRTSTLAGFFELQQTLLAWLSAWSAAIAVHGRTLRRTLPEDERLARVVLSLNEMPATEPYCAGKLLQIIGLSAAQMDRLFVAAYGMTPRHYHERRRVEVARLMLDSSETPVKNVALHLGFRHAAHFTQWFKRHTGCAPVDFRGKNGV